MKDEILCLFPTRVNQKLVVEQLSTARQGLELLKSKSMALQQSEKNIEERLSQISDNLENVSNNAFLQLSRSEYYGLNIKQFRCLCMKSSLDISIEKKLLCGLELPVIVLKRNTIDFSGFMGIGVHQAKKLRKRFELLVDLIIEMAEVETQFRMIKESLSSTNRRLNALEQKVIPQLENTRNFIASELDEQEREEFYRLKKIQKMNK